MTVRAGQVTSRPLDNLSILVSCYNKFEFIKTVFDHFKELEDLGATVIVIDDGSTDGSSEELVRMRREKNLSLYLERTENQGAAGARSKALGIAKTDFIYFLDIDDTCNIKGLIELFSHFMNTSADLALGNFYFTETGNFGETVTNSNAYELLYSKEFRDRIFEIKGWWRFIYRRDFVMQRENRLNLVFSEMVGKKFVLDDVFWMLHLASIDVSILQSPSDITVYNYCLPEYNGKERWNSYLRQIELLPEATILYMRDIGTHKCKHDEKWLYSTLFKTLWDHATLLPQKNYLIRSLQFFKAGQLNASKLSKKFIFLNLIMFSLTPLRILKRKVRDLKAH
jgi:glycosyltransferase involved in cell wall biosynthesis